MGVVIMTYDRRWYTKVPIEEINKLIAGTGWDVKTIYAALSIQEAEVKLFQSETWGKMKNYHWDEPEYKELLSVYKENERKLKCIGTENFSVRD